jgi:hypothetical protein
MNNPFLIETSDCKPSNVADSAVVMDASILGYCSQKQELEEDDLSL